MNFRYDTYCGLYCGACEIMYAFQNGLQEKLAEIWQMDAKLIRCYGCKSGDASSWCNDCEFKECAISKEVEFCFECDDYPCQMLKDFQSDDAVHHSSVLKGLERIKEIGRDNWLQEQSVRWSCDKCGARSTWYRKKCDNCGAELDDCSKEDSLQEANHD